MPINSRLRGSRNGSQKLRVTLRCINLAIMPGPIVLANSEGEDGLNGPPEMLSNTAGISEGFHVRV